MDGGRRQSGANYVSYHTIARRGEAGPTISTIAARLADEQRLYILHQYGADCHREPGSRPSYTSTIICHRRHTGNNMAGEPSSSLATALQEAVPTKLDYYRRQDRRQKCPSAYIYARIKRNSSTSRRLFHIRPKLKLTLLTLTEYTRVCACQ